LIFNSFENRRVTLLGISTLRDASQRMGGLPGPKRGLSAAMTAKALSEAFSSNAKSTDNTYDVIRL
jgi:hypothetical protein